MAFDAGTGSVLWSASGSYRSPGVSNGVVFAAGEDDFNAFDAATGLQLWSQRFGAGESSPVVANGVVYVADGSGISATNAATGQSLWSGSTGGIVYSSPAVANGVLYLGSDDDNLYAFGLPPHSTSARAVLPPSRPNPAALKPDPKLH